MIRNQSSASFRARLVTSIVFVALTVGRPIVPSNAASEALGDRHFFPARPAHATLHTLTGTLSDYAIGNASGSIVIARGSTKTDLYAGAHLRIDGREVACDFPPIKGKSQSEFCTSWPRNVVLGTTVVTATYWLQSRRGIFGNVKVTDALRTTSTSSHP